MKSKFLIAVITIYPFFLNAQWTGSGARNTTGDIYRTGNVSIGTASGSIPLIVYQSASLGLPYNSTSIIRQLGGLTGPNTGANKFNNSVWLRKVVDNDNTWYGTALHDGISIDVSYGTPGVNTKTWWERNPSAVTQSWGDLANTYMTLKSGNLGIGTTTPATILNVDPKGQGSIMIGNSNTTSGNYTSLSLGISAQTNGYSKIQCISAAGGAYGNIVLNPSGGNILIGKTSQTNTGYLLDIAGNVRANKLVVNTTGADYVFDSSYTLLPLQQVELFINQNHHLPQIASAGEMQNIGLDLGKNQTQLLGKIEELTLYVIEQNKTIEAFKTELAELKKQINQLKK